MPKDKMWKKFWEVKIFKSPTLNADNKTFTECSFFLQTNNYSVFQIRFRFCELPW